MDLNLDAPHSMGTTIIGVTYNGGVVLGADSRTSTASEALMQHLRNENKNLQEIVETVAAAAEAEEVPSPETPKVWDPEKIVVKLLPARLYTAVVTKKEGEDGEEAAPVAAPEEAKKSNHVQRNLTD